MTTEFNFINEMPAQPENEDDQYDDDVQTCDCCGRDLNGYDGGSPCPFCCPSSYAPGSEECDFCAYSDECFKMYHERGLA